MRRHSGLKSLAVAALAVSAALPAAAAAKVTELGALADGVHGGCPEPVDSCAALTRVTGYQAKVGPDRGLYQAPADGRVVAWSVALGAPTASQIDYFSKRYGGPDSQAALVVLDPGKKLVQTAVAKAPLQRLNDFFGQTVQFPLDQTLPIKKGQYVALTVPTWAPALQLGLGNDTSWRSSRDASGCGDLTTQFGLLGRRTSAAFRCLYRGVRMTYSATFIDTPTATPAK